MYIEPGVGVRDVTIVKRHPMPAGDPLGGPADGVEELQVPGAHREQRFDDLKWSPRREPMIGLLIALWVAATNVSIQESHRNGRTKPSSIKKRRNQIREDLGRSPVRIPPRT